MNNKEIFEGEVAEMVERIDKEKFNQLIHSIYESMTREEVHSLINTGRSSVIIGYALREYAKDVAGEVYDEHQRGYRRRERQATEK